VRTVDRTQFIKSKLQRLNWGNEAYHNIVAKYAPGDKSIYALSDDRWTEFQREVSALPDHIPSRRFGWFG
jgi:hypothetical protein